MEQKKNKPVDSPFIQQKLKTWNLKLSKKGIAIVYLVSGCIWILIGAIIIIQSNSVIEHTIRYDNETGCKSEWKHPRPCTIEFKLDEKMRSPIFVYYEISGMYQTHKKFIKNRDIKQLMGKDVENSELESRCLNAYTMQEMGFYIENHLLGPKSVARPCGIFARSYFNDTYEIIPTDSEKGPVEISFDDISWSFERDYKFKNYENDKMWTSVEKGHFINWMNPAGLSSFRKLWGKIENDLEKGKYYVKIHNNYDISDFDGEKSFILTTASLLGGKMIMLGVIALSVGVLAFLFGISIFVMLLLSKRKGAILA